MSSVKSLFGTKESQAKENNQYKSLDNGSSRTTRTDLGFSRKDPAKNITSSEKVIPVDKIQRSSGSTSATNVKKISLFETVPPVDEESDS